MRSLGCIGCQPVSLLPFLMPEPTAKRFANLIDEATCILKTLGGETTEIVQQPRLKAEFLDLGIRQLEDELFLPAVFCFNQAFKDVVQVVSDPITQHEFMVSRELVE